MIQIVGDKITTPEIEVLLESILKTLVTGSAATTTGLSNKVVMTTDEPNPKIVASSGGFTTTNNGGLFIDGAGVITTGSGEIALKGDIDADTGVSLTIETIDGVLTISSESYIGNGVQTAGSAPLANQILKAHTNGSIISGSGGITTTANGSLTIHGSGTFTTGTGNITIKGNVNGDAGTKIVMPEIEGTTSIKSVSYIGDGVQTAGAAPLVNQILKAHTNGQIISGSGGISTTNDGSLTINGNGNITMSSTGAGILTTGTGGISLYGDILDGGNAVDITVGGHIRAAGNVQAGNGSVGTSYLIVPVWTANPPTTGVPAGSIVYVAGGVNRFRGFRASNSSWVDLS